jgi:hypothetical protein
VLAGATDLPVTPVQILWTFMQAVFGSAGARR